MIPPIPPPPIPLIQRILFDLQINSLPENLFWVSLLLSLLLLLICLIASFVVNGYLYKGYVSKKRKMFKYSIYVATAIVSQYLTRFILMTIDKYEYFDLGFPFKIVDYSFENYYYVGGLILNIIVITIFYFIADKLVQSYLRKRKDVRS
ncbi:MAG TPA: hypothetical protein PLS49_07340 [Candidatus Woesebacteria bacterium]|nr:hypothetical protein [Candidatus Woesebacteria bacterium]